MPAVQARGALLDHCLIHAPATVERGIDLRCGPVDQGGHHDMPGHLACAAAGGQAALPLKAYQLLPNCLASIPGHGDNIILPSRGRPRRRRHLLAFMFLVL